MENPETLATLGTRYTEQRQTKQTRKTKMMRYTDPTKNRGRVRDIDLTSFSNFRLNIGAVLTGWDVYGFHSIVNSYFLKRYNWPKKKVHRQNKMSTRTIDECS
jgi:hypothetical protein